MASLLLAWILALICTSYFECNSAQGLASTPPRGWNSYDSFSWVVTEEEFLANAAILAQTLAPHGYEYAVVDFLWFRKNQDGVSVNTPGFDIVDDFGRPVPDPVRWPSTANGRGFAPIAAKVHAMGLKFGIHVMRGISDAAIKKNTPVFGTKGRWKAQEIALTTKPCSWMNNCFYSVNTKTEGGQAFIKSLYDQYASWGVDFIKHDCVFGTEDLSVDEIQAVSKAITDTGRPIVYSLSPGVSANPAMASSINSFVHMYRVTNDDWDLWSDLQLHFDVARDFAAAGLIGAQGLQGGRSWPDLDMLPFGWLTDPGVRMGPHRWSSFTPDEQRLQMTLWAMAKSPFMFGGDLRKLDDRTRSLITNSWILDINAHSLGNSEISVAKVPIDEETPPALRLVKCKKAVKAQWRINKQEKLCWSIPKMNNGSVNKYGCMNWNKIHSKKKVGHIPSWNPRMGMTCLDARSFRHPHYLQARGFVGHSCSKHSRQQKWHLTPDGKLRSRSTGLCAAMYTETNFNRIWSARGSDGEYYIALFNVGTKASNIQISVQNIVNGSSSWQCTAADVWSNQNVGLVRDALSVMVAPHGSALYSMTCSLDKH